MPKPKDPVTAYARQVIAGKVPACEHVVNACKRHVADMKRKDIYLDLGRVELALGVCNLLKHYKGEFNGQPFIPEPWEEFVIGSCFGWIIKETGKRRYREALALLPRKNGKTFLAAAVGTIMLLADGEGGAEVYSVATKKDQAKISWKDGVQMIRRSPALSSQARLYHNSITVHSTASVWEPLASDSEKLDGLNCHCNIFDETHAWKDRNLYDVCVDSQGARSQPLNFMISTAGNNIHGICRELRTHGIKVVDPKADYSDDRFFAFICEPSEEDAKKWDDPKVWAKVNPNLGVSKSLEYMEAECHQAKLLPAKENSFKNKQLNIWTKQSERWLQMSKWDRNAGAIDLEKIKGQKCVSGLDLSSVSDITAHVLVFPPGPYPEFTILPRFWIPEDYMRERVKRDRVPYDVWVKQGFIKTTPGEVIDTGFIEHSIKQDAETYQLKEIAYDPWKASETSTNLSAEGLTVVKTRQGFQTLSGPMIDLEKKMLRGELRHGGNPVLRWMADNIAVRRDPNDNIAPDKNTSREKIDGMVALIMAMSRAVVYVDDTSVYEGRGLLEL